MKSLVFRFVSSLLALTAATAFAAPSGKGAKPDWSMNASIIEACSCPMFCQCYFTPRPAGHASHGDMAGHGGAEEHFCRANNVFQVNKGWYKGTRLDGAKFWASMDLGDDFTDGTMKWAVITFDPSVTPAQREGILAIVGYVYPVKWETPVAVAADLPIEWSHQGMKAVARLDGGKAGEVVLNGEAVMRDGDGPAVIKNLHYWGVPRHEGFVLMPNEVEAYRLGPNAFEYKGTNGFMITFDINANDVAKGGGGN